MVAEIVELPEEAKEELEGVLAGNEGEDRMKGRDCAPACGKDEEVGGTIRDEARRGGRSGKVAGEEGTERIVEGVGNAIVATLAVECEGEIKEDGEKEGSLGDENCRVVSGESEE